jgi:DNA-directed RNA polymerase specialized sigma24 family protein
MINDENWTRKQVIDLWFDCSQEQIASILGISLGKVNSIIKDLLKAMNGLQR